MCESIHIENKIDDLDSDSSQSEECEDLVTERLSLHSHPMLSGDWADLKELKLVSQNITALPNLAKVCTSLKYLDLSNNSLSNLSGLPKSIRYLKCCNNKLDDATSFLDFPDLVTLRADGNLFTAIPIIPPSLLALSLNNNRIHSATFSESSVMILSIRHNCLNALDTRPLLNLRAVDVSGNELSTFTMKNRSLTMLEIESSAVADFNIPLPLASRIRTLNVSHNKIRSLDLSAFQRIERLECDGNVLERIIPIRSGMQDEVECKIPRSLTLPGLEFLTVLTLKACKLFELGPLSEALPSLVFLDLSFNQIRSVEGLKGLSKLSFLSLRSNCIHEGPTTAQEFTKVLQSCCSLKLLDMRDNPLTAFYPPQVIKAADSSMLDLQHRGTIDSKVVLPQELVAIEKYRSHLKMCVPTLEVLDGEFLK